MNESADRRKSIALIGAGLLLTALALFYSFAGDTWIRPALERFRRRGYYEGVIRPKGLSLHRALFWKKEKPGDDDGE